MINIEWLCSCQGQSCSGAVPSLWLCLSGSSPPSGLPCPSLAGESTTTSPSGPAALWTTARETGNACTQSLQCYQVRYRYLCVLCASLEVVYIESFVYFSLHRNYVSYLIPMTIFNMVIQVFVVMSSYQSIAQKFKKTGNPRVSKKKLNPPTTEVRSEVHALRMPNNCRFSYQNEDGLTQFLFSFARLHTEKFRNHSEIK